MLIGIALATLLAKFVFIWTGRTEGTLVADDAYYYFSIACNISSGVGSSFDGLAPTNGYHPLWMALLIPIFKLWNGDLWTPVRAALSLSATFDALSGFIVYRSLSLAGARMAACVASLLWWLSPYTVLIGLRGMEASASTLIILLLAAHLTKQWGRDHHPDGRSAIIAGLWVGLSGLARTDNLVSVGLATAAVAVGITLQRKRPLSLALRWVSTTAFTSLVVVSPWLIWNQLRFGSVLQVSGAVKLYSSQIYGSLDWDFSNVYKTAEALGYTVMAPLIWPSRFLAGEEFRRPALMFVAVGLLLLSICVPAWLGRRDLWSRLADLRMAPLAMFGSGYMLFHTVLFGAVCRTYAIWYALPYFAFLNLFLALALVSAFHKPASRPKTRNVLAAGIILLHGGLYYRFLTTQSQVPRAPEQNNAETLELLSRSYPDGVIVGRFNAGAFGYAARSFPQIKVTNLDGLVNNQAFEAARNGTYLSYVLGTVEVLAEYPDYARAYLLPAESDSLERLYQQWDGHLLWSKNPPP